MSVEVAPLKIPWAAAVVVGLLAHAPLPFIYVSVNDDTRALLEPIPIDLTPVEVEKVPTPPPPPPAPAPVLPRRQVTLPPDAPRAPARAPPPGADPKATDLAFMQGGDSEPPPPSNRAPPPEEPTGDPVPVVTGIPLESTVKGVVGVAVRVGNTYSPGFERDDIAPEAVRGYAGGKLGGSAAVSGGTGEPGSGTVGGGRGWQPSVAAGITRPPKLLKRFRPHYPKALLKEEIEGDVVLRVEITREGAVRGATVIRSDHPELSKLALSIIKRFVWRPALKDGIPVDAFVTHSIRFELY